MAESLVTYVFKNHLVSAQLGVCDDALRILAPTKWEQGHTVPSVLMMGRLKGLQHLRSDQILLNFF